MAKNKPTVAVKYNPDPTHYLLNDLEFERLCEVAKVPEKENLFFLLGLLVPSAMNCYSEYPASAAIATVSFYLNFIVAVLAGIIALFQGRAWYSKRKAYKNLVAELRERPEGRFAFTEPQQGMYIQPETPKALTSRGV